jgi:hypothetical protein
MSQFGVFMELWRIEWKRQTPEIESLLKEVEMKLSESVYPDGRTSHPKRANHEVTRCGVHRVDPMNELPRYILHLRPVPRF